MMDDKNENLPKWLRHTQHNSWEPEVFISGIVLFGLLQLPDYLADLKLYLGREVLISQSEANNLLAFLSTGIQWITAGLICHLFFRGVWIGMVGLSYVFPEGIDYNRLRYREKFRKNIRQIPGFTKQIIRLEKISSSIFSISYLIFMCILGAYFFILATIIVPVYSIVWLSGTPIQLLLANKIVFSILNVYTIIVLSVGVVYLIDFLTLGLLKKIKWFSRLYYPVYKVISILTFSGLYRNVYYVLISNFRPWKVILFNLVFISITIAMIGYNSDPKPLTEQLSRLELYGNSQENYVSGSFYSNMQPNTRDQRAAIQSDIVKDDVLRLFVAHRIEFEDSIKHLCDFRQTGNRVSDDSLRLRCLSEFYQVSVGDSLYSKSQWMFHRHPVTGRAGIVTWLDISSLNRGQYNVKVNLKNWRFRNYATIPFYKE